MACWGWIHLMDTGRQVWDGQLWNFVMCWVFWDHFQENTQIVKELQLSSQGSPAVSTEWVSLETNNSLLISPFSMGCHGSLWHRVPLYIATSRILCNGVYMHIYKPSLIPRPAGLGMKLLLAMWHIPSVHGKVHSGGWFQTWSRHVCTGPMNTNQPTWNYTQALSSLVPSHNKPIGHTKSNFCWYNQATFEGPSGKRG